ncbi:MAG: DUF1574 domain-containing protein [Prevotella sp.]|nr:DUF1574 domain-containing protein [Prevotella sp.]
MKKFILKVSVFFLVVLVFDILSGKAFSYLADHAKGGDNMRNNYICNGTNEDILVFGSSRAIHHYNPIIISDSLGMSCYNCGQDGNGAILNYGRYQLICQRYHPKILIYDVIPEFDLLTGENNHKYLGHLRPYYDRKGIDKVFESVDDTEKYKMMSQMYRYNSRFVQVISDYIQPLQSKGIKGFRPLHAEMDTMKISKRNKDEKEPKPIYDPLKIEYINKMVNESKDTKVVFVVSPCWDGMDTTSLAPVKTICQQQAIPFIDYSNNPKYFHHNEYFKDGTHLNARGADEFTRDIIQELKKIVTN